MARSDAVPAPTGAVSGAEIDAVLAASRVLVAISARSLSVVTDEVDVVQLRVLVVIASRGAATLSEIAQAAQIHLSKASRTCDRLSVLGLIDRADGAADRRTRRLTLTASGRQLVNRVMQARRRSIKAVLARLSPEARAGLVLALQEFAAAGGEPAGPDLWAMGWTT